VKASKSKSFTNPLLKELELFELCKMNDKNNSQVLNIKKPGIKLTVTLPVDVYEIFWAVKSSSEDVKGWDDFSGKTKEDDYRNALIKFKELIDGRASLQFEDRNVYYVSSDDKEMWY